MKTLKWIALGLFLFISMMAQTQTTWAKLQPSRVAAACAASKHCASFPGTDGGFGGCFTDGKGLCFSCTKSSCWVNMQANPGTGAVKPGRVHVVPATPLSQSLSTSGGSTLQTSSGAGGTPATAKVNAASSAGQIHLQ